MTWQPLDTWIVVIGVLAAVACGILGCFMVLRRMSMMGDAISHAVLPGLAVAFLVSGQRDSLTMFVGAAVVGILTALLTQLVHRWGRMDMHASMGVVFTTLFAVGLLLIVRAADDVDLDPGCVLYGAIEYAPLYTIELAIPTADKVLLVPRAALVLGVMTLVNILFVVIFYKELAITSFDPQLATTLGIRADVMHYVLMALVAATAVAAFEAVGSILVVAMLIVPGATAHLLTNRLSMMLVLSALVAAASAGLGHVAAITVPPLFGDALGVPNADTSTAGSMAVVAGVLFGVAALGAPQHGIISRVVRRWRLTVSVVAEDALGLLYRLEERDVDEASATFRQRLRDALGARPLMTRLALRSLRRRALLEVAGNRYQMTGAGRTEARRLVRAHRLWETYLVKQLDMRPDHVHETAMRLEHVTGRAMREDLAAHADHPRQDPHGKVIPDDAEIEKDTPPEGGVP